MEEPYRIPAAARIGHVHLKVANLERSLDFYQRVLGFDLILKFDSAAFLSAGGYHHHLAINTWYSKNQHPTTHKAPGLFHFAINYPHRADLAKALQRLLDNQWPIAGTSDHTTHEAIYLSDPDQIGIELAWDRDPSFWVPFMEAQQTGWQELSKPLEIEGLLNELGPGTASTYLPLLTH